MTIRKVIIKATYFLLPAKFIKYLKWLRSIKFRYPTIRYLPLACKLKCIHSNDGTNSIESYVRQAEKIFKRIHVRKGTFYIYPFDPFIIRELPKDVVNLASLTPDYEIILNTDLKDIIKVLSDNTTVFSKNEIRLIDSIITLARRIENELYREGTERCNTLASFFNSFLFRKPTCLDEAIQKLLFFNALFWQMWHWHNGLGRLDLILYEYYKKDITNGVLNKETAKLMIKELCLSLGKDSSAKSMTYRGDTGQYILLGGVNKEGITIQNELTELFLEVFSEYTFPDPKLILRANEDTSDKIWDKSVKCVLTGNGSPLFMNEKLVMQGMISFGYKKEDVWNVGTSACWEPLVIGKSFDQNNALQNIPIIESLNNVVFSSKSFISFDELLSGFKGVLEKQILSYVHDINFDCSPLFSLFFDNCIERRKDFSHGGACYSFHGVQVVGFPNLVNALMNIKDYVFDNNYYSISDCSKALLSNYNGYEDMRRLFLSNQHKFGGTDPYVVNLTNDIMLFISNVVSSVHVNGERVKVGFSSSVYIEYGRIIDASLDGRKKGDPFAVHISPVSHKIDIQEVIDFASLLNYDYNRLNGNVVDFILPTSFVHSPEKLKTILKSAINKGVFELQLNVLDAETLKDAKLHPERHKGLVVRVWGFSAYFNDLPEEYKDNLIKRAEMYA